MILYKGFEREDYLNCFINGEIRFTLLKKYREIEKIVSKDKNELIFRSVKDGILETKELGNNVYGLCLTTNLDSAAKFGKFIARINDLDTLVYEVRKKLVENNISFFGELLNDHVNYTKGLEDNNCEETDYIKKIIYQKSPEFNDENEYRIAFIGNEKQNTSNKEVITIKVDKCNIFNKVVLL